MLLSQDIRRIIAKELTIFFSSPMAYLFLAAFSSVTLFVFFWVETFFARNIADVRPLFEWMPILLIFLSSTLTMRLWSEEKRSGTLEHILTQPVGIWSFVWGKYLACLFLLILALLVTLPIPISISFLGELDWGPVWSGYLASFVLGAAYISLGLFVSARSDNQIVSLISSVALCGFLYLIGSATIVSLFDNIIGDILRFIGTGSRFDSITRGVVDFRDLYFYISLAGVGLVLNVYVLEKSRWSDQGQTKQHWVSRIAIILVTANLLIANTWITQVSSLRLDTTEGKIYSISDTTKKQLLQLQEPLLIRGYFSSQTHPLLAPLVPQIKDLLREYEVAGNGFIKLELIDPAISPELEDEANNKYSIRPIPFQIADRYQTSVVNSYFDILLQYGDEFKTIGFKDLIEIRQKNQSDIKVLLRNPEYDITSSIKKILQAYQSEGNLFSGIKNDLRFLAYVSADDKLPKKLKEFRKKMNTSLEGLVKDSGGILKIDIIDPDANGGQIAEQIGEDYGFKPMIASLQSTTQFFYYMLIVNGNKAIQIPLKDLQEASFKSSLESGIKRLSYGFTKTIGIVANQPPQGNNPFQPPPPLYNQLSSALGQELNVSKIDLSDGSVDGNVDLLVLLGLSELDDKSLFAVDQYLMRGGSMIVAASPFESQLSQNTITMKKNEGQLLSWLKSMGLGMEETITMDEQSAPFPVPVTRKVGEFKFQEVKLLKYPYFNDIRGEGLNSGSNITSSLKRVVVAWGSPILVEPSLSSTHKIVKLLETSDRAWTSNSRSVVPKLMKNGSSGFTPSAERGKYTLGVSAQGRFNSWFADKKSPLVEQEESTSNETIVSGVVTKSAESAKIVLFSSSDFVKDSIIQLIGSANRNVFRGNIELMKNAVESSLDGSGLQGIRARGNFNRTLPPLEVGSQQLIEYLNYFIAFMILLIIAIIRRVVFKRRIRRITSQIQA